ncbi:MAG: sodium:solute symporter family transporter, partial [Methylococcales bacterium]
IWAFYMFLGTSLYVFFQVYPAATATEMLQGVRPAEGILPYFISHFLPSGCKGLVIAAVLAAAMSSLDSSINSVSTVWVVDIYRRHLKPGCGDRHYLKIAWVAASVTSLLMVAGADYLANTTSTTLQDTATILASLLAAGMLGLYLLGFFTRRPDSTAVWIAIGSTALFTGWTILSQQGLLPRALSVPFDLYYTGIIGNLILFAVGYALGRRRQKPVFTVDLR